VFLSLRPETYYKSRKRGALSGYHTKAFTIVPPNVEEVILKRLRFSLMVTQGEVPFHALSPSISVRLGGLEQYVKILINSFERNKDLIRFVENISRGNIRLALQLITTFIGSGHVNTRKILELDEKGGSVGYVVPLHEFFRAIVFEDNENYDPSSSHIVNIFDVSMADKKEHFILPLLIDFLLKEGSKAGHEGFVKINSIYDYLQNLGYVPAQIDLAISRALDKGLIESEGRKTLLNAETVPQILRATTVGSYHVNELVCFFPYFDAIVVDTPILDSDKRESISNVQRIEDRLVRARDFKDYLDLCWEALQGPSVKYSWPDLSVELTRHIISIEERVKISIERKNDM